jgi:hypothetical protein
VRGAVHTRDERWRWSTLGHGAARHVHSAAGDIAHRGWPRCHRELRQERHYHPRLPQTLDGQHLEECGVGLECRYETTVTRFSRSVSTELGLAAAASLLLVRHRSAD